MALFSIHHVVLVTFVAVGVDAITPIMQYYVSSSDGNDDNSGVTPQAPLKTVSKCLQLTFAAHADSDSECVVQSGTYRESINMDVLSASGTGMRKLRSAKGARILFSGLTPLPATLDWILVGNNSQCIWQANVSAIPDIVNASTKQLFYNGTMMVQAQYPNLDIGASVSVQALTPSTSWVRVDPRSHYGTIIDSGLKEFPPESLNGARATLNVAHQYFTWTRRVSNFSSVNGSFNYPKNLPSLAQWVSEPGWWKANQFFLSGTKVLLDAAGEWVFDEKTQSLLFWPPPWMTTNMHKNCFPPSSQSIEVKVHDYVLRQAAEEDTLRDIMRNKKVSLDQARFERSQSGDAAIRNFHIDGVDFIGAAIALNKCDFCRLTNARFMHPSFDQEIPEMYATNVSHAAHAVVSGNGNYIENVSVAFTNNQGFSFSGSNGTIVNSLFGFADWLGTLSYKPVSLYGINLTITRATAYAFGNAGIVTYVPGTDTYPWTGAVQVSYSHVHGGGLVGRDHALLYTGDDGANGVRWHHNIVHNTTEKCLRADDLAHNTTMDHNVVFDCGIFPNTNERSAKSGLGIVPKGDSHLVFANTVFRTNNSALCVPSCPRAPYAHQNMHSNVFNTAAQTDTGSPCSCNASYASHPGGNQSGIYTGDVLEYFVDAARFDFRPKLTSALVDAGVVFPPYTDGFVGRAPDIGAMEAGVPLWTVGCVGLAGCDDPEDLLALEEGFSHHHSRQHTTL
eukprot:m.977013 g.977013  ORF g.977013 m.977013 type:complete len:733 (-) comp23949_c1_seq6:2193-4391(-)